MKVMGGYSRANRGLRCALSAAFCFVICAIFLVLLASPSEARPKYAAIVIDHNSGKVLYSRNADAPRYPASLTKIMTLYLVFKELKAGKITLDHKFVVTREASGQTPSKLGLKVGSTIKVRDAVRALVTKSANDAAVVIAENFAGSEARFAQVMTQTARSLGMKKTTFKNASGLPDSRQVTTARDMATLSRRVMNDFPKLSKYFKLKHFKYRGKRYRNHNGLLFNYRGTNGIKTGYIRASGFNLAASVKRGKKHLIGVVMGGRSVRRRNANMRHILNKSWRKASRVKKPMRTPKSEPVVVAAPRPTPQVTEPVVSQAPARKAPPRTAVAPKPQAPVAQAPVTQAPVVQAKTPPPVAPPASQGSTYQTANNFRPTVSAPDAPTPQKNTAPQQSSPPLPSGVIKELVLEETGPYHVQIGAFDSHNEAHARLIAVHQKANDILKGHEAITMAVNSRGKDLVRARFAFFSKEKAKAACKKLKRRSISCLAVPVK